MDSNIPPLFNFETMVDENQDTIILIDSETYDIIYANKTALITLNKSWDDLIGTSFGVPIIPENDSFDMHLVTATKEIIVETRAQLMHWHSTSAYMVTMRDVTQQRATRHKLRDWKRLQFLDIMSGGLCHDFNNILTGITGNVGLLDLYIDEDTEPYKYIKGILESANEAKNLISKFSMISYSSRFSTVNIGIKDFIDSIVHVYRKEFPEVHITVKVVNELANICVNRNSMCTALKNIIRNSMDAMYERGEILITLEALHFPDEFKVPDSTLVLDSGSYLKLTFEDDGCGMTKEVMSNALDPYFSTKQRNSKRGMGLGLTISYGVIKKHHGHILLESKEDIGTSLIIYLPYKD